MKQIKMTMKRKDGSEVVIYFDNVEAVRIYCDYMQELTQAIIDKTRKEKEA